MKKRKTLFGKFCSPYAVTTEDTMTDWYDAYQSDLEKHWVSKGKTYSKIIYSCEFYAYDTPTLLVSFEPVDELRVGDVLIEEHDHEFVIKAFEMIRFAGDVPKWYLKVSNIAIQGKDYSIGEYLSKKYCP